LQLITDINRLPQLELKLVRDRLEQHKTKVTALMDSETEAARRLLKEGRKERALTAIKKKRMQVISVAILD
jgi:charged multivesicular body protein 6